MTAAKLPPPLSAHAAAELRVILKAPYGLRGFRRFARLLGLKIEPFQGFMLGFYFAGIRELVILISKKNGKTTLLAALALYHLLMVEGAECVIGASSRDQATILFTQAAKLVQGAGLESAFEVRGGYRMIRRGKGRIRVLAADADTADGVIPTLALVDELHRHPSGELYGVFRDGLLGNAQMITISTAGAAIDSPLGRLLTKAREFAVQQLKKRRTYTSADGSFVMLEWALGIDDDPHDMGAVKDVNPAPWHTKETLRQRHDSPSTSIGQWLRFACGIWTEGDEPAITGEEWDRLYADIGTIRLGDSVILAPSVGHTAAIGIAALREGEVVAIEAEVLEPREGRSVLADTEQRILKLCEIYDVKAVHHPLGGFLRSADILAEQRVPMVEAPHSPMRLTAASGTFDRLRRSGLLIHSGDPVLRNHVLAGQLRVSEQGERYLITERSRALIAVLMAVYAASAGQLPKPTIHIWQGVG
ncbi:MAG: terminase large subunit domain-containing protein [bacterium]